MAVRPVAPIMLPSEVDPAEFSDVVGTSIDVAPPRFRSVGSASTMDRGTDIVVDLGGGPLDEGAFGEGGSGVDPTEHGANLAEYLRDHNPHRLVEIGSDVGLWVEQDIVDREEWEKIHELGLELMGLKKGDIDAGAFEGASNCTHPALLDALINFQSRTSREMLPAKGPVKAAAIGNKVKSDEVDSADRVARFMNYRLQTVDKSYYPQVDRSHFWIGFYGCSFGKICFDASIGAWTIKPRNPLHIIYPYNEDFSTSPRITDRIRLMRYEYDAMVQDGVYLDEDLGSSYVERSRIESEEAKTSGVDVSAQNLRVSDADYDELTFYECRVYLRLDSDIDDGIHSPYICTVERESQKVVAIYRNWKEGDERRQRINDIVMEPFIPGLGSYPYGLPHLFAGICRATSDGMNLIMDASAMASFQGGFKTKDANGAEGDISLKPNTWLNVDATLEELQSGFYTPPFKEPSPALVKMWENTVETARRSMFNTDLVAGDGKNTGPVGTTMALIEQAGMTPSSIHRRLHIARGQEFQLLYERMSTENIPEDGYPYDEGNEDAIVYARDFDGAPNIAPVSDPNIFSSTQRIALAQALIDRSAAAPGLYKRRRIERLFLEAIQCPSIDDILIDIEHAPRCDPATENGLAIMGQGLIAKEDEAHQAHYAAHMAYLQMLALSKSPFLQVAQPILLAHAAQHQAMLIRAQVSQQIGFKLPPMTYDADSGRWTSDDQKLPPQVEQQVAMQIAQWEQQQLQQLQQAIAQQQGGEQGGPNQEAQKIAAQVELEKQLGQARIELEQQRAAAEERRKQEAFDAEQRRAEDRIRKEEERKALQLRSEIARKNYSGRAAVAIKVATAAHAADQSDAARESESEGGDEDMSGMMEQCMAPVLDAIKALEERISKAEVGEREPVTINTGPVTQVMPEPRPEPAPQPKKISATFKKNADGTLEMIAERVSAEEKKPPRKPKKGEKAPEKAESKAEDKSETKADEAKEGE